jgi:hypothetical protein
MTNILKVLRIRRLLSGRCLWLHPLHRLHETQTLGGRSSSVKWTLLKTQVA